MKKLWKTYVLPNVDYCSTLWFSPDRPQEIRTLEKHQSRFLNRIDNLEQSTYWEALKSCNMYSITRRLERYTILYTWKSLTGLVPDCGFQLRDESRDSKLRIPTLAKSSGRVRTLKEGSFRVTGVKLFNSLPSSLRSLRSGSLESFKNCLDSFLSN